MKDNKNSRLLGLKWAYRIYLGGLLIFWFVTSFTLIDTSTFWAFYPFQEGGILDILEMTVFGGLPYLVYKIYQRFIA